MKPNVRQPRLTLAIVLINVGLLVSLLFGPASARADLPVSRIGIGIVALGLVMLAVSVVARRTRTPGRGIRR